MRESVTAKAKRLLREREDRIRIYESGDEYMTAMVQGDSGIYTVAITEGRFVCDCPARGVCSHVLAIEGWKLVREGLATWEDVTQ